MESKIFLISGKQGSGKSTTALALAGVLEWKGWTVKRISFATPLKEMESAVWDVLTGHTTKYPRPAKDGKLLQLLGTEWGRSIDENIWVQTAKDRMNRYAGILQATGTKRLAFIIDDARFPNEFDAFPDAFRVRLEASPEIRRERTEGWRENTEHPSETGLDAYAAEGRFSQLVVTDGKIPPRHIAEAIYRAATGEEV